MHILRSIFFVLFIAVFSNLRSVAKLKESNHKVLSLEKFSHLEQINFPVDINSDECRILKRKYKSRGTEVAHLYVSGIPFHQISVCFRFLFFSTPENYVSFLYCVDQKRGPPRN